MYCLLIHPISGSCLGWSSPRLLLLMLYQLLPVALGFPGDNFVELEDFLNRFFVPQLLVIQLLGAHALDIVHQALVLFKFGFEDPGWGSVDQLSALLLCQQEDAR